MLHRFRYLFRYYFIRKKSPLSYIWWCNVLRRDTSSEGLYALQLADSSTPDAALCLKTGAPKDNVMEIIVYDGDNTRLETVEVKLSYHSMKKIREGFHKATAISRQCIKEENLLTKGENRE